MDLACTSVTHPGYVFSSSTRGCAAQDVRPMTVVENEEKNSINYRVAVGA